MPGRLSAVLCESRFSLYCTGCCPDASVLLRCLRFSLEVRELIIQRWLHQGGNHARNVPLVLFSFPVITVNDFPLSFSSPPKLYSFIFCLRVEVIRFPLQDSVKAGGNDDSEDIEGCSIFIFYQFNVFVAFLIQIL